MYFHYLVKNYVRFDKRLKLNCSFICATGLIKDTQNLVYRPLVQPPVNKNWVKKNFTGVRSHGSKKDIRNLNGRKGHAKRLRPFNCRR